MDRVDVHIAALGFGAQSPSTAGEPLLECRLYTVFVSSGHVSPFIGGVPTMYY